ncbi:MAG: PP2C family protein-serine/threonine phosphatase, partial [Mariprofundaceae bacterium]
DSTTRPWLLFTITGLVPTSLLALFAYFASMETTPEAQHFIAGQGLLLFVAGLLASICLVWLITRSLKLVTGELSKGLEHLRHARFDSQVAVLTDDDLGNLARGLNIALNGLQEREELKGSLAVAAEIQQGLLPQMPHDAAPYAFAALEQSCQAVGGDYYDVIQLPDGRYWLVVADVAGKGYPAALTVANLQAMLHVLAAQDVPLDDAVAYINRSLCRTLTQGRFVTLFMAILQPQSHSMLWLNAGHVPPLLQSKQSVSQLKAATPPLGVLADMEFATQRAKIAAGDRLFVYTDGVTEAQDNVGGEMFGAERLNTWLQDMRNVALEEIPQKLLARLEQFGGASRDDDVTVLCLEREEA